VTGRLILLRSESGGQVSHMKSLAENVGIWKTV